MVNHQDNLLATYFHYWQNHDEDDFWAWEEVNDIVHRSPEAGWALVIALLVVAPSKAALAYVAAGPLEDLLCLHGPELLGRIKREAPQNERLRFALAGVWLDEHEDKAYPVLMAIVSEYHLAQIDPIDGIPWSIDNPRPG